MASDFDFDLTIWNSYSFSTFNSSSKEQPSLFSSHRIQDVRPPDLSSQLAARMGEAEALGESLVSIIQIKKYTPAIITTLESCFSEFPRELLENVVLNTASAQNISVIPSTHDESTGIRSLLNFPFVLPSSYTSETETDNRISFLPVAVWLYPSSFIKTSQQGSSRTNIVLICTNSHVSRALISYYGAAYQKRWMRLQKSPTWIFPDILHTLGGWWEVWNITKQHLGVYHRYVHELSRPVRFLNIRDSQKPRLLDLARQLHDENAILLSVREQLRVHSAALSRFLRLPMCTSSQDVIDRLQEHLEDINYHEETSQVLTRQLENIMSLVFSIETMAQGQAVARLNILAFAFLPLSWVASLFGMTQFSLSAAWYPLGALIALLVVVAISFALPIHGFDWSTMRQSMSRRFNKDMISSTHDPETPAGSHAPSVYNSSTIDLSRQELPLQELIQQELIQEELSRQANLSLHKISSPVHRMSGSPHPTNPFIRTKPNAPAPIRKSSEVEE
ncbi:hypothetical protein PEBR_18167 [Penicillium brasilianum]|uniref:CorA family metal ion transporter n=1 Tax=Penicillium brasilianum TaxID=104259 RepID=A0A1S9RNX0_PENBI|nr:hypothetical protein PEBR_18167 [Penicillium brasilianum]